MCDVTVTQSVNNQQVQAVSVSIPLIPAFAANFTWQNAENRASGPVETMVRLQHFCYACTGILRHSALHTRNRPLCEGSMWDTGW